MDARRKPVDHDEVGSRLDHLDRLAVHPDSSPRDLFWESDLDTARPSSRWARVDHRLRRRLNTAGSPTDQGDHDDPTADHPDHAIWSRPSSANQLRQLAVLA